MPLLLLWTPVERALLGRQENQAALLALDDAGLVLQHMKKAATVHDRDGLMEVRHPDSSHFENINSCECGSAAACIVTPSGQEH